MFIFVWKNFVKLTKDTGKRETETVHKYSERIWTDSNDTEFFMSSNAIITFCSNLAHIL
jgi:hypothetical protein